MNWDSLSYRQKNKILLVVGTVLLLCCYFFAFEKTFDMWTQKKDAEQKIASLQNAPRRIAALRDELDFLNSRVQQYVRDENFEQEDVLASISGFCENNGLKITNFPQSTLKQKEDITIETFQFTVTGSFHSLVKLIYDIEVVSKIGRIASLQFEKQLDRRTKRQSLHVTIYLENLRTI